jgi:NADPH:quinone reductase
MSKQGSVKISVVGVGHVGSVVGFVAKSGSGGDMMRALQIDPYADHSTARLADAPVVAPRNGQVRVRIQAAGLNPLDGKLAQGHFKEWFPINFPYVLGTDFAGVIEEIGHSVEDFRPGDAVFGRAEPTAGGALAEAVTLSANLIAHRPAGLDAASAAALPTPAGVAYQALSEVLNRPAGSKLLILGAGAVAHTAVQLARDLGGVTVCGRGAERLRDLGIDVIEPSSPELATVAANSSFVLDTAGGNLQATVIPLLRPGTHVAAIVNPVDEELAKSSAITADYVVLATRQATLNRLARLAADAELGAEIAGYFRIDQAPETYRAYAAGKLIGKHIMQGDVG